MQIFINILNNRTQILLKVIINNLLASYQIEIINIKLYLINLETFNIVYIFNYNKIYLFIFKLINDE